MSAKRTKANDGPSDASLREMPEARDWSQATRGKFAKRFPRDAHAVVIDPKLWAHFGSADAVNDALRAIVKTGARGERRPAKKRRTTAA